MNLLKMKEGRVVSLLDSRNFNPLIFCSSSRQHGTCNSRDSRHNTRKTGANFFLENWMIRLWSSKKWFWAENSWNMWKKIHLFLLKTSIFVKIFTPYDMIQQTLLTWLCWLKLDLRINDINCIIDQLFTNRCSIWWSNLIKYLLVEYLQMF